MPISANPRDATRKLHSVGLSAGPEIRLCEDEGDEAAAGKEAEVCVRGECVTLGYEVRPHMKKDPNLDAFHTNLADCPGSPWLRTGDKGYIDPDGYLVLVGRFKEIINRGGEKISPFAIEHVLGHHPACKELVVFAVPHAQVRTAARSLSTPHHL